MSKYQINPKLAELSPDEFKKWIKQTIPDEADKWESHYAAIGGKLPDKKAEKAK